MYFSCVFTSISKVIEVLIKVLPHLKFERINKVDRYCFSWVFTSIPRVFELLIKVLLRLEFERINKVES